MTQYARTSVALTPEQKAALDEADRNNSEIIRDLVDAWRRKGDVSAGVDVAEEELENEIDLIEKEIGTKQQRKQLKQEQLERLRSNDLHPNDEEAIEDYLNHVSTRIWMNPNADFLQDYSTPTLSIEELIIESTKRAESLPIDSMVASWRQRGIAEIDAENVSTGEFANTQQPPPDREFVVELLKARHEALPEDWEGAEEQKRETNLKSAGRSR